MTAFRREVGRFDSGRPGPTLLVLAGIHGNEPAGLVAAQRVLSRLLGLAAPTFGRFIVLAGNLGALSCGQRYLHRDLNRGWGKQALLRLANLAPLDMSPEDREQRELVRCFEAIEQSRSGPLLFVDLHTSSANGPPFLCLADTIDNRRLGLATHVPIILGIEETIEGASLEWFADRGIAALAVEGGGHQHPDTVDNHEAVLWLLIDRIGLSGRGVVDTSVHARQLARVCAGTPPIVEIVHRQVITSADGFVMEPGFVNFAKVAKGTLLARDRRGDIRASGARHVLLPLYQAHGDDGFFLGRRVWRFWLHVARWLRALRFAALLRLLPGVRRDPADALTMLVDPTVARWWATEVFHLLGFRKQRPRGALLAFSSRWSRPENRRL